MKREEAVEKEGEGDKNKKKADDSHVNLENGSGCVRAKPNKIRPEFLTSYSIPVYKLVIL